MEISNQRPSQSASRPSSCKKATPSKTALIGGGLGNKYESALIGFLRANRDIFTWKPVDMPVVPMELIEHCLKVNPKATPKKQ
jgi:hypothetical protein